MNKHWMSIHIFYYGSPDALIVNCIAPLIEELRKRDLLHRYFFIKYWMEGPHVRLRLLPAGQDCEAEIQSITEQAITSYLKQRPALYQPDAKALSPFYKSLFIAEYGQAKWLEKYGEDGMISIRPNNSFAYIPYEPEYFRYGGIDGIELAEWHFDQSSDIIIELLREVNVRVPTILLGISIQLSLPLFYGFFADDQQVMDAFDNYIGFWQNNYSSSGNFEAYNKKYQRMAPYLQQRILEIKRQMVTHTATLTPIEAAWKAHIHELHTRVDSFIADRSARLMDGWIDETGESAIDAPLRNQDTKNVYHILLNSYIHMTNNRLGVTIPHEVYLAFLLKQALGDQVRRIQEVNT